MSEPAVRTAPPKRTQSGFYRLRRELDRDLRGATESEVRELLESASLTELIDAEPEPDPLEY